MAVIDATPGSPTANSFATVEYADAYFDGRLYNDAWVEANADERIRALITATRLIVQALNRFGWRGWPVSSTQRLPMPRYGVYSSDGYLLVSTTIPEALADATSEYAGRLLANGGMPDAASETEGLRSLKAGPISLEFTESGIPSMDLPDAVFNMIAFLVVGSGKTVVPLSRA